jgi:hypothetical protein
MLPNAQIKTVHPAVKISSGDTTSTNGNGHKARHRRPPLSATEAALIAVALANGRLSAGQACRLTGANASYFALVNGLTDRERELLAHGKLLLADIVNAKAKARCNGSGKGNGGHSTETLVEHMRRASADELRAAGREFGVAHVFDSMVVPNLNEKGADVIVTEVKAADV